MRGTVNIALLKNMSQLENWFFEQDKPYWKLFKGVSDKHVSFSYPADSELYEFEPEMQTSWAKLQDSLSKIEGDIYTIAVQMKPGGALHKIRVNTKVPVNSFNGIAGHPQGQYSNWVPGAISKSEVHKQIETALRMDRLERENEELRSMGQKTAGEMSIKELLLEGMEPGELRQICKDFITTIPVFIAGLKGGTAIAGTKGIKKAADQTSNSKLTKVSELDLEVLGKVVQLSKDFNKANGLQGEDQEHPADILHDIISIGNTNDQVYVMLYKWIQQMRATGAEAEAEQQEELQIIPPRKNTQ